MVGEGWVGRGEGQRWGRCGRRKSGRDHARKD